MTFPRQLTDTEVLTPASLLFLAIITPEVKPAAYEKRQTECDPVQGRK